MRRAGPPELSSRRQKKIRRDSLLFVNDDDVGRASRRRRVSRVCQNHRFAKFATLSLPPLLTSPPSTGFSRHRPRGSVHSRSRKNAHDASRTLGRPRDLRSSEFPLKTQNREHKNKRSRRRVVQFVRHTSLFAETRMATSLLPAVVDIGKTNIYRGSEKKAVVAKSNHRIGSLVREGEDGNCRFRHFLHRYHQTYRVCAATNALNTR